MITALKGNMAKMPLLLDANFSCPYVHHQGNTHMSASFRESMLFLFKALQKYSSQDEECLGEKGFFCLLNTFLCLSQRLLLGCNIKKKTNTKPLQVV